jgi:2-methylcitrate dehydratase PrpD
VSTAHETVTARFLEFLHWRATAFQSEDVREAASLHLLDSIAAIVSGRRLAAGMAAAQWISGRGQAGMSSCAGLSARHDVEHAALFNAMCAHADESDDSHEPSRSHPGASVIPVVLAMAENHQSPPDAVLEAIVVGYEACALMNWLIWGARTIRGHPGSSTHAYGGLWGSAMAAGWLSRFDDREMRSLIGYTAHLAGGARTWLRDKRHVEKAFAFAGMPAWNAVRAAGLVAAGWPGVNDALDGSPSFFSTLGREADTGAFSYAAARRPAVLETSIKKYCVGSPAQAAVQAAEELATDGVIPSEIIAVRCFLPAELAVVVDNRAMSDINVQYLLAATLADGVFSFALAHDPQHLRRPDIAALMKLTKLAADPAMQPIRQARVEVDLSDGRTMSKSASAVRGSRENPMTRQEVEAKARDLMGEVLDAAQCLDLIRSCQHMDANSVQRIARGLRNSR